jgi:DNA-binding protein HU-beta
MNKAQLVDALAERLGDKKVAAAAVAGLVDVVIRAVNAGDRVTITGFGVFEKRARAARTARNPRTGEAVIIQQTDVPAFRPGTLFREVVSGTRALPQEGTTITAAAANQAQPETMNQAQPETIPAAPTSVPTTTAVRRPASRVTAGAHLTAVRLPTTKSPKTKKAAKAAKGEPKASSKIATKTVAAKTKGSATSPAKGSEKKAGKKSVAKKSATKK